MSSGRCRWRRRRPALATAAPPSASWRWRLALVAGLAAALSSAPTPALAADPVEVSGIRFGHEEERTRIVIEADQALAFLVDAIDDPPRLIVDLPSVSWRIRSDPLGLGNPRGLAIGHRYGRFDANRSRLVVDMAGPFRILDRFLLPPRDGSRSFRLVIDLVAALAIPRPGTPGGASVATVTPPDEPPPPIRDAGEPRPSMRPGAAAPTQRPGDPLPAALPSARPLTTSKPVIVLDPGHGGVDPGARAVTGVDEKEITLAFARELRRQLLATGRYRVAMTRESDEFVALRERIRMARESDAALFISLHADSIADPEVRGASVYTLSDRASDAEAARLAVAENKADILAGADLSYQDPLVASILIDLARRDTSNHSIGLAERLVEELGRVTELVRNTRRFAGFVVLKSPETPSVLVELGYLSHPGDAAALIEPRKRTPLAAAIVRAVDRHLGHLR